MKICAFTGHRPRRLPFECNTSDTRYIQLKTALRDLSIGKIESENVVKFISGMALGVDMLAAEVVLELQSVYSEICLEAAIPCADQPVKWCVPQKERYHNILARCTQRTVLQKEYTVDCMEKRNQYMIDHADFLIAVWDGKPSGTGKTVRYAMSKGVAVMVLDPQTMQVKAMKSKYEKSGRTV